MALIKIVEYPDPFLAQQAKPLARIDKGVRKLADDMAETMYDADGIGLAAPQVGEGVRMIMVDISEEKNELMALVNPVIIETHGAQEGKEGCLSVPGIFETVNRAERVRVRAEDLQGKTIEIEADGLLAVCLQHEIDHLGGKVFVDYLSRLKQTMVRKKLAKRRAGAA